MGAAPHHLTWGAYDHVVLCQLWGRMLDLPEGIPMWTHDFRQEVERQGLAKELPSMPGTREHNALSDARELRYRYEWLKAREPELHVDERKLRQAIRRSPGTSAQKTLGGKP